MKSFPRIAIIFAIIAILVGVLILFVSTRPAPGPKVIREPIGNFDAETQSLISSADRVVFLIPFSHWDTDWHQDFNTYSKLADQIKYAAILIISNTNHCRPKK